MVVKFTIKFIGKSFLKATFLIYTLDNITLMTCKLNFTCVRRFKQVCVN